MSVTLDRRPAAGRRKAREASIASPSLPLGPLRRRWGRIGAGAAAAVIGAWIFAALYQSAGDRTDVIVVARPVERLATIERSDLRVERVSADSTVATVPAAQLDQIVGRIASTDLVDGSLLAGDQLRPAGDRVLADGEAIVGVLLAPGDAPVRHLRRGVPVSVVVRPPLGDLGAPLEIDGWVFDASAEALNNGDRSIEVAVSTADAATVSSAAAEKRVTIVALSE